SGAESHCNSFGIDASLRPVSSAALGRGCYNLELTRIVRCFESAANQQRRLPLRLHLPDVYKIAASQLETSETGRDRWGTNAATAICRISASGARKPEYGFTIRSQQEP